MSGTVGYACGSSFKAPVVEDTEDGEAEDEELSDQFLNNLSSLIQSRMQQFKEMRLEEEEEEELSDQFLNNLSSLIQSRMQQFKEMRLEEEEESDSDQFMKTVGGRIRRNLAKFTTSPKQRKLPKSQAPKSRKSKSRKQETEADNGLVDLLEKQLAGAEIKKGLTDALKKRTDMSKRMNEIFLSILTNVQVNKKK